MKLEKRKKKGEEKVGLGGKGVVVGLCVKVREWGELRKEVRKWVEEEEEGKKSKKGKN